MHDIIADGHRWLGYLTFLLLLGSVVWAFLRARSGSPYTEGFPRLVGLVLAGQVLVGLVAWASDAAGALGDLTVGVLHPIVMLGAVGLAGVATARARDAGDDAASWSTIARFQGFAVLAVIAGIGLASA